MIYHAENWRSRYGYPLWYIWAGVALILAAIGSTIAAFYPMNVRWFLVPVAVALIAVAATRG